MPKMFEIFLKICSIFYVFPGTFYMYFRGPFTCFYKCPLFQCLLVVYLITISIHRNKTEETTSHFWETFTCLYKCPLVQYLLVVYLITISIHRNTTEMTSHFWGTFTKFTCLLFNLLFLYR